MRLKILEDIVELNEKYRHIKYIELSNLSELIGELDSIKEKPKINLKILIKAQ
jgi:hypothetical protein